MIASKRLSFGAAALLLALPLAAGLPDFSPIAPASAVAGEQEFAVQAASRALAGDFMTAGVLAQRSGDAAAIKLVEFLYLKDKGEKAGYSRLMHFLDEAPKWPLSETFLKRAEMAMFLNPQPASEVLAHVTSRKPLTAEGMFAVGRAKIEAGDTKAGKALIREAWKRTDFEQDTETRALKEFGNILSADDHRLRLWRLVMAQAPNAAMRSAKRLGGSYPQAVEAAKYLIGGAAGADRKLAALPASLRDSPAMKYVQARYYRRLEKFSKARNILAGVSSEASATVDPEALWTERRIIARRSVGPHLKAHWDTAYKIASNHGLTKGDAAVEAEFLSGWIALRYKNDANRALKHFSKLQELAPTRTEKARAAYWLGRAHLALSNKSAARSAFENAAQYTTIYYGQMAREHLGLGKTPEVIASGAASAEAKQRVNRDEVVRAFRLLNRAGGKDKLNLFLWSLASRFDNVDEMNAVADMVSDAGGASMALRLAKAAGQRNVDIDAWSYPINALPNWQQVGRKIEKPLVFALSRQESEFNAKAGSKAGAQGLMQLMPGTARLVAKQYGLSYAASKLTSDPAYNVKLGAAHLADLVSEYNGSYILTLVAYNAGPRRVGEWIADYGDPRRAGVDPIDWVESIPFHETRQYVQKVLQNVHVYRSRLAPQTVVPMSADLRRGGAAGDSVASTTTVEPSACTGTSIAALATRCD